MTKTGLILMLVGCRRYFCLLKLVLNFTINQKKIP